MKLLGWALILVGVLFCLSDCRTTTIAGQCPHSENLRCMTQKQCAYNERLKCQECVCKPSWESDRFKEADRLHDPVIE